MKPIDIYEHPFAFVDESITQMSGKMQYLEDMCFESSEAVYNNGMKGGGII